MICVQGYTNSKESITLVFDSEGIDEFIRYLNFIKSLDASMHLNLDNELTQCEDIAKDMYTIPHLKLLNIDKLDPI